MEYISLHTKEIHIKAKMSYSGRFRQEFGSLEAICKNEATQIIIDKKNKET